ncbi:MAG TPA: PQQ-binding-like beta-propeller repeat protein [Ktedonobacteraceae bacterium]|nr:PQQ-binding-like beta-propeller repeat protein [Ktedonobacteraceae bacterium]
MMSKNILRRRTWLLLLLLCIVLSVSACGKNSVATSVSNGLSHNVPLGTGMTPEPGTNGKPMPRPDGHSESMVASNGVDYVGSDNGRLYALNGNDGTVRWQYNTGASVYVAAIINGTVYVNSDGDISGVAYAFNASNGMVLWHYNINNYISQLMVEDGIVYVGTAARGNSITLYALQASNGLLLWSYSAQAETPGLLTASNGVVFYAEIMGIAGDSFNEHITALNSSDGSVLWSLPIAAADCFARGTPAVLNGAIYFGTNNGSVYAVRIIDGKVLWHVGRTGGFDAVPLDISPLIDNGMVFIEGKQGPGGQNEALFAMRASDGKLLWSRSQGVAPGPMVVQAQISSGVIFTVDSPGGLTALRESDGSVLWQHTGDQVYSPFTVADGQVQINSGDSVLALGASDGTLLWKRAINFHSTLSSADTPEFVDNGIVYVATTNGTVQALDASNGKLLWQYIIQELAVPTDPVYFAQAQFSNAITYQQAIRLITDLGLHTYANCTFDWKAAGNSDVYSSDHLLTVAATVNSAPLWFNRLQAASGVIRLYAGGIYHCPIERYDPNALKMLGQNTRTTFVQVTFANSSGYDSALDGVNNLGFRLANPCYEQARARGDKPTWSTAGQENPFAQAHTLVLSTTGNNATVWMQQLRSLAGVTKVDAPVATVC